MRLGHRVEDHNLAMLPWPLSVNFLIWKRWDRTVDSKGSCNTWSSTLVGNAGDVILSRHLQSSTQEDNPQSFALAHGGILPDWASGEAAHHTKQHVAEQTSPSLPGLYERDQGATTPFRTCPY